MILLIKKFRGEKSRDTVRLKLLYALKHCQISVEQQELHDVSTVSPDHVCEC